MQVGRWPAVPLSLFSFERRSRVSFESLAFVNNAARVRGCYCVSLLIAFKGELVFEENSLPRRDVVKEIYSEKKRS